MVVNANSIVHHVIQIKNGIIKHVNVNIKIIASAKKIIVGILAHVLVTTVSIKKAVSNSSVIACDEVISVMDIVSTKMTKTIATNVTSTSSINCHSNKVRYKIDCYIFTCSFISSHITIDNYYYLLSLCKAYVKTKKY